ncbi:MAG: VWA domain-containing protein [Rhodocyclaceae bacterium]|nr:VWA domain-containing protein [Rhodocyclaceae bacterium]
MTLRLFDGGVDLCGAKLQGILKGVLLEATMTLHFVNQATEHTVLEHRFYLPPRATVLETEIFSADSAPAGAVKTRNAASGACEDALYGGSLAALLECDDEACYTLRVGNLAPREFFCVRIRYASLLKLDQGTLRLKIPSILGIDAERVTLVRPAHRLPPDPHYELRLIMADGFFRAIVLSPSHSIGIQRVMDQDTGMNHIILAGRGYLVRDFVLLLSDVEMDSFAVTAPRSSDPQSIAVLASFRPLVRTESKPLAVRMLVDCTNAMEGPGYLQTAKLILRAMVSRLDADDRFSLSTFGQRVRHFSRDLWDVNETTRVAAENAIEKLRAYTNCMHFSYGLSKMMRSNMRDTSHSRTDPRYYDLLIITSATRNPCLAYGIDDVVRTMQSSPYRVFVFGIGLGPAGKHLHRLAAAFRGACEFVVPGEMVEPAVEQMLLRLRTSSLPKVKVVWPGGASPEWIVHIGRPAYDGDTLLVAAGFRHLLRGTARLLAHRARGAMTEEVEYARTDVTQGDALTSRLCCWIRLSGIGSMSPATLAELRELAVAHQLVTGLTSFLAVSERSDSVRPKVIPNFLPITCYRGCWCVRPGIR